MNSEQTNQNNMSNSYKDILQFQLATPTIPSPQAALDYLSKRRLVTPHRKEEKRG